MPERGTGNGDGAAARASGNAPEGDPAVRILRREAGRLTALLGRIVGTDNLEIAEDAIQETLLLAMQAWREAGIPDNPPAWLFRVARNKAIDAIRRQRHAVRFEPGDGDRILLRSEYTLAATVESKWGESSLADDMLGMMFACCHPGLGQESQIALVLKILCGFGTAEIAQAFLVSEDTVSKRLFRAKEFFRREKVRPEIPPDAELKDRLGGVLRALYLLFNEGYLSARQDGAIRRDLIGEALHLGKLLVENPHTADPRACALMALMCFHAARSGSRLTQDGDLILLPDQDRGAWDARLIGEGCGYLDRSATGEIMTAYHLEAAIAYEHCRAPAFAATDWVRILQYYRWLCRLSSGPIVELNRVAAVLQAEGPAEALRDLGSLPDQEGLRKLALYHALLGEIHNRMGEAENARAAFAAAAERAVGEAERRSLRRRASPPGPNL